MVKVIYEGHDPPFEIRGPFSKIRFRHIKHGVVLEMCEADANVLCGLPGFRKL